MAYNSHNECSKIVANMQALLDTEPEDMVDELALLADELSDVLSSVWVE